MSSISEPFVKRPVMTLLCMFSMALFGAWSYWKLPVSDMPDVDYPVIQVQVSYPGASPEVMAANVASPLERQFLQISGIESVSSENRQGNTSLILLFDLSKSLDAAATDVQSAINMAQGQLPRDLPSPPTYSKVNPNDQPVLYIGLASETMTGGDLYDIAFTQIAQRLQTIDGVAEVQVYGAQRSVRIEVDPQSLYNRGLTMGEIGQAVQAHSNMIGAGEIKGSSINYAIQPNVQLDTLTQYEEIIVKMVDGQPVYVRDVARVAEVPVLEDLKIDYWADGIPPDAAALVLAIRKSEGANTVQVADRVYEMYPVIRELVPSSVLIAPIYNAADTIRASVDDVQETLVIAFVLVCIVIFLFLGRARDTLIPVVALPMSLLLTFIAMHLLGYTLDNLSLMALTLSIGFLVDDAVVFLENMVRRMEDFGESPLEATLKGAREISFTILSMTLSLAAAFIPLLLMEGLLGRIFREFSVTIVVAVIMSGVVSLTLTPLMTARMLKSTNDSKKTRLEKLAYNVEHWLLGKYGPSLSFFLKHGWISGVLWFVCIAGNGYLFYSLPKTFIPIGDSGFITGVFITQTGTSGDQMHRYQRELRDMMEKNPYVEKFVSVTGVGQFLQENYGIMFILLVDEKDRPPIEDVNAMLSGEIAQIPGLIPAIRPQPTLEISAGGTSTQLGQYAYVISGLDADAVMRESMVLYGKMWASGLFASVNSDLYMDNPQLELNFNRDKGALYGVTPSAFATTLNDAYALNYSYLIKTPSLQYQVIVEAAPQWRSTPENLDLLYYRNTSGNAQVDDGISPGMVPLSAVAEFSRGVGPLAINHFNNFTSVTLYFDMKGDTPIGDATAMIASQTQDFASKGLTGQFQGQAEQFEKAVVSMALMLLLAFFVMYVILGILYESYMHPITVLAALPVALVGGCVTLWAFGQPLSLYSMIGMFVLIGIVKKNGIMMIDFALQRQAEGMSPREAVHKASMERFRPIMMTTIAAVFGAVPIALGWGADAEARKPLGSVVVGGLLISQLITLYIIPVLYLFFNWMQDHVMDKFALFQRGERMKFGD